MTAVAVREAAMRGGLEADYLLLINGRAAAVLEAKREEIALDNPHLIAQAENYTKQVPSLSKYFLIANQEGTEKINGHPISARKEKSNPRENPFQGDYG